jgi:outer membrane protein OmpA-like peptidoglycan-associated protein/tetratricopeptide (TPR) repeat protein
MRYYFGSLIVILMLYSSAVEAQSDVSVRRKEFKTDKPGFKEAWKHVTNGDSYYKTKGIKYNLAFDEYLKALVYNSSNPELNYKTGVSALFSDNKEEAAGFLLKASDIKNNVAGDILFITGRALQYTGRFTEAIKKFNAYLNSAEKKPEANIALTKKYTEECISALNVTRDTLRIAITNMGANINSESDDYAEIISSDGKTMYFASRREMPKSSNYYDDSKFDENIFISQQSFGSWGIAASTGKNLTTKYCETPLYINSANNMLYVYAGYKNDGDIMVSENKNGEWKTPGPVSFGISTKGSQTSFTFNPSGNEIYFVTDNGKDNFGGKDIYFIKKTSEKKWSKPLNAGPLINTIYDEESPRFSKKGDTLWFSSQGHNSTGGFDIFYSVRNADGKWDTTRNCGYPVNTAWDEIFYYPSPSNDSLFYFASNRSGGLGGLDIYNGRILPPPPPPPVIVKEVVPVPPPVVLPQPVLYLTGTVKDSETGEAVISKIDVIDIKTDSVIASAPSDDVEGSYRISLPGKKSYRVDVRATGFLSEIKQIDIPESYTPDIYNLDVTLVKVKVGRKVVLNNILFETGKSVLTAGSYDELNRLLNYMLDYPLMKIEVSGHTDITGSAAVNLSLSEARAKAVVMYLTNKGIDNSRMKYHGYGAIQPISDNTSPQGRARNRRVEFKILEF